MLQMKTCSQVCQLQLNKVVTGAGVTVNLNINAQPSNPVVLNQVYTPVTTAVQNNDVNVFVNTIVIINTVVQVDAFVQATVYVCNTGASAPLTDFAMSHDAQICACQCQLIDTI